MNTAPEKFELPAIRKLLASGLTLQDIADALHVGVPYVRYLRNGGRWFNRTGYAAIVALAASRDIVLLADDLRAPELPKP